MSLLYKTASYFNKETAIKCFEFSDRKIPWYLHNFCSKTESMPFLIEQLTGGLLELTFPVSFCIVPNVSEQRIYSKIATMKWNQKSKTCHFSLPLQTYNASWKLYKLIQLTKIRQINIYFPICETLCFFPFCTLNPNNSTMSILSLKGLFAKNEMGIGLRR